MSDAVEQQLDVLWAKVPPEMRALAYQIRRVVLASVPEGVTEDVKKGWKNVVYKGNTLVCAIAAHKGHANLIFFKGEPLTDPEGVLIGDSKMRHLKYTAPEQINAEQVAAFVREAFELDGFV